LARFLGVVASLIVLAGCGGSGGSSVVINPSGPSGNNVASVEVDLGPTNNYVNGLFTSVEVCVPGSTSNCITVPNVLVDTGSSGLRLLSDAVPGLALPSVNDTSGNPLQECVQFVDLSYVWGPVVQADIHMANETASKASIQIISASPAYTVPSSCLSLGSSGATDNNTVQALGANGILGVGNFAQDCGSACSSAANVVPNYYVCTSAACEIASVPLADQLSNPVALFAQDNNGVLISLPSVPLGGAATATGSMIFGVGTQSNNALGNAQIYAVDALDDFTTTYQGVPYSDSYIDSGSNITYFLDSATLGNIECTDMQGFYCPPSDLTLPVTNTGANGTKGQVTVTIRNADSLVSSGNAAFNDLAGDSGTGPSSDYVDFGIPFFFGRTVFVGIEGKTVPNGASAPYGYWAY
jgi:hypothetical protein